MSRKAYNWGRMCLIMFVNVRGWMTQTDMFRIVYCIGAISAGGWLHQEGFYIDKMTDVCLLNKYISMAQFVSAL